ncbi:MAG: type II-A CRISPR-associated protein Csn2 [Oscillospiraceae bacterium]|nr:type II-A CRISPR-associated protein Csn2 [Oscillospiraceae bacterium]
MMLACYFLEKPIEFFENKISVIVIENQKLFRKAICEFIGQSEGKGGSFILSENFEPLEFSKKVAIIPDIFNIDFSSKKILAKINQEICENFSENEKFYKVRILLNEIGYDVISDSDFDLQFSEIEFFENIVKIFDFRINSDEMEFIDKVIEYMKFQRSVFGKEVFVFINLKSCLAEEEIESFYQWAFYNKFKVLLIESFQRDVPLKNENIVIIDRDLCEIY